MLGPAAVEWLLSGLMGATGLYCLMRLLRRAATRAERELDASETLKGLGMAAMALPYGLGRAVPVAVWVVLFGAAALWSLAAGLLPSQHRGHHLYHGVGHLAMVYMAVAMAAGAVGSAGTPGMSGMAAMAGGAGLPLLTGALLLFFGGYVLVGGVRLISAGGAVTTPAGHGSVTARLLGAPELPQACRMVLGMGMFTMLLVM